MNSNIKAAMMVRLVVGCIFLVLIYLFQQGDVFSALVGFMANFIPETYQGWKISKTEGEYNPHKWLRLAHRSMISKWLMTAMIFAISFNSEVLWNYKILFAGYMLIGMFGLLAPILIKGKK